MVIRWLSLATLFFMFLTTVGCGSDETAALDPSSGGTEASGAMGPDSISGMSPDVTTAGREAMAPLPTMATVSGIVQRAGEPPHPDFLNRSVSRQTRSVQRDPLA